MAVEKVELHVPYFGEALVLLVFRVDIVLDLGHGELTHAQQPRTRRYLVTEGTTDLCRREWHPAVVEFE